MPVVTIAGSESAVAQAMDHALEMQLIVAVLLSHAQRSLTVGEVSLEPRSEARRRGFAGGEGVDIKIEAQDNAARHDHADEIAEQIGRGIAACTALPAVDVTVALSTMGWAHVGAEPQIDVVESAVVQIAGRLAGVVRRTTPLSEGMQAAMNQKVRQIANLLYADSTTLEVQTDLSVLIRPNEQTVGWIQLADRGRTIQCVLDTGQAVESRVRAAKQSLEGIFATVVEVVETAPSAADVARVLGDMPGGTDHSLE